MTEFEISILNLKIVHKKHLEYLEKQIQTLQEELVILKNCYERIYDL